MDLLISLKEALYIIGKLKSICKTMVEIFALVDF